ncbi:MAG: ATP-binding protein, partial [Planctomycetota bacterium]
MAKLLEQVQSGKTTEPRRVMLYGTQGIGKSTWGAQAPNPIFIQTEDGLGQVDCDRFPMPATFDDVIAALSELYSEKHPYRTVVVDTLDWLEQLIWAEVCKRKGVENIEDIGYAKGYTFALTHWREVLDGLDALRNDRGMTVALIAHSKIDRFENPETETYDRYTPRLHKHACAMVCEWSDEVLFATYRVHTKQTDEGFGRKKARRMIG